MLSYMGWDEAFRQWEKYRRGRQMPEKKKLWVFPGTEKESSFVSHSPPHDFFTSSPAHGARVCLYYKLYSSFCLPAKLSTIYNTVSLRKCVWSFK